MSHHARTFLKMLEKLSVFFMVDVNGDLSFLFLITFIGFNDLQITVLYTLYTLSGRIILHNKFRVEQIQQCVSPAVA